MSARTRAQAVLTRRRAGGLTPWPPLLSAMATAGGVVGLVVVTHGAGGELAAHVAGLVLAAAAGYLLDDPAAAVTQAVPRPLWRRRSATVVRGIAVLAAAWALSLALVEWRTEGVPVLPLTLETAVIAVIALTAAALMVLRGEPEPGNVVAPAVALLGIGALLLQPSLGLTLFLSADPGSVALLGCWAAVGACALVVLVAAGRDPASRRRR
jgi:hypothetical protein